MPKIEFRIHQASLALLLIAGVMLSVVWSVAAAQTPEPVRMTGSSGEFEPGQLLVKFQAGVSAASAESTLRRFEAEHTETLYGSEVQLWRVPVGDEVQIGEQLSLDPSIEYAEPNYRVYALDTVPNDPSFDKQWAHTVMRSPAAWDLTTGATTITIAILDTGIDGGHPDLKSRIVGGYDAVDGDSDPRDLNGHGTHVAGIVAAVTNNGVGVAGMDWKARILPIRVLEEDGDGYVDDVVEGVNWAVDIGAKVLNLSLGTYEDNETLRNAIASANSRGVLVVAAMGNDDTSAPIYPAAYVQVLAVAATGPNDAKAPYSNSGNHCDVAAPGGAMSYLHDPAGIYSTMPTYHVWMTTQEGYYRSYDYVQGTSEAAPYVAGLASLIWAQDPALSAAQVQNTIKATAQDLGAVGWDPVYGYGRVDALAALQVHSAPLAPVLAPINNADGDGFYLVNWNDVPYATSYVLQEADSSLFSDPTLYEGLSASQLSVTGRAGGRWYYRVRARNSYGESPWSGTQMTVVRPDAPMLFLISDLENPDQYELTWSVANGATGYRLEEAADTSFIDPTTRYRGDSLHYHVTGQPGGTWHYRVVAYNSAGESLPSNVRSIPVPDPALPAPDLVPIDNEDDDGDYLVSWSAVAGASTYTLEESADPYFSVPTVIYTGSDQQTSIGGKPRGRWYYRVRAAGEAGKSPWSQPESALVPFWTHLPLVLRNYARPGLVNGGFEDGPVGWAQYSLKGLPLILNATALAPVTPHSGIWAARLGREHDGVSFIEQDVSVPEDSPFLHYWHWISSQDECGFDVATVRVKSDLAKVYSLCKATNTGRWVETVINLGSYSGQTVTLQLRVEADSALESSLFVDDFSFESGAAGAELGRHLVAETGPGR